MSDDGYHVIISTATGDFIALIPPFTLNDVPAGASATPITRAEWKAISDGSLTWDPQTRAPVESTEVVRRGNKERMLAKLWAAYGDNITYIATPNPEITQNQTNRQVKDLTRQVDWLIRLVTEQFDSDE